MITDQEKKQFFMWRDLKKRVDALEEQILTPIEIIQFMDAMDRHDAMIEAKFKRLEAIISELGGDTT